MLKINQLVNYFLVYGLFFSLNLFVMGQTDVKPVRLRILENQMRLLSASLDSRAQIFSQSAPKDKSDLFRFHLALQLVKHSEMNQEQKNLILDSISLSTPETYLESNRTATQQKSQILQQRAMKLFSRELGNQIFADLSEPLETIEMLKKYQSVIALSQLAIRKSVIDKSTPAEISFYYKMQMALSLVINFNLTREQQNLIIEVMSEVKPELYVNKDFNELQAKQNHLKPLKEKIIKVFPVETGGTTFAMIGDTEIEIDLGGGELPRCHCLLDSWFSGCTVTSRCNGGSCNDNPNNGTHCGFIGLYACDGRCS